MDSLNDILLNKNFDEPPEVAAIKNYIKEEFDQDADITIREREIIVSVRSASLAGALRMRSPEIQKLCQTDKRLVFRIG